VKRAPSCSSEPETNAMPASPGDAGVPVAEAGMMVPITHPALRKLARLMARQAAAEWFHAAEAASQSEQGIVS